MKSSRGMHILGLSSVSALNSQEVLTALKASSNPEALATHLLQSATGDNAPNHDTACAQKTGYEHCTDCAMPAIKTLVTELVLVKDTVWQSQKDMSANADTVCDQDAPANRAGGAAKCCSASATTSSYQPAGFNGCTAGSTFSPKDTVSVTAADVKYNQLEGSYYDAGTPSSMVTDCCRVGSTCRSNDVAIKESMDVTSRLLASLMSDKTSKQQKIDSVNIEVELEAVKLRDYRGEILKICEIEQDKSTHSEFTAWQTDTYGATVIDWPATEDEATAQCKGGQVFHITTEETVRQTKLTADSHSFGRTIEVIERVIAWLDGTADDQGIFKNNLHTDAPTVGAGVTTYAPGTTVAPSHDGVASTTGLDAHWAGSTAMVSLLEGAAKSSTNTQAKQALAKAAQLLEGGSAAVRGAAAVIRLLKQILGDMQSSKAKIETYKTTSQAEADAQIINLVAQITNLKTERTTALLHKARLTDSVAGYTQDVATKTSEINDEKNSWALKYDQRELNSDKCIKFMNFFDAETQTNTEELLILKKTIDIIKHITCQATSQPTAFPTSFPTTSPTVLTASPTAYPTRAPTAVPTGAPTANPTTGQSCIAGNYKFMSKVFANPERFAVPAYADGVLYAIDSTMNAGDCKTLETSHTNVEGAVQTIKHQYKCCGDTGNLYGAISQSDNSDAKDLCADSGNEDHCGLFGANMYTAGTTDPSGTVTTGQTTAPTAAPTSFPTRAPSDAPTAYPTKAPSTVPTAYPTEAPTDYPTALAHADDALQVASAYNTAVYNITEEANSTEVSGMIATTAAPTKAPTTAYPTAYPTAAPTEAPTEYPTAAPTEAPTKVAVSSTDPNPTGFSANAQCTGSDGYLWAGPGASCAFGNADGTPLEVDYTASTYTTYSFDMKMQSSGFTHGGFKPCNLDGAGQSRGSSPELWFIDRGGDWGYGTYNGGWGHSAQYTDRSYYGAADPMDAGDHPWVVTMKWTGSTLQLFSWTVNGIDFSAYKGKNTGCSGASSTWAPRIWAYGGNNFGVKDMVVTQSDTAP